MFMCQGHDGEDVRMLDCGGLWHFSILGWEHHIPDMELYHARCASVKIGKRIGP